MKTSILDAWPVLEWLYGREPAATFMEATLEDAKRGAIRIAMSATDVGEV